MVNAKSYCTNVKTRRDEASQVTDLSPGLTTCDTERRSPAHPPPLARAPRDDITACDQVPHSDNNSDLVHFGDNMRIQNQLLTEQASCNALLY